ncbi:MAG: ABC transporter permease subunit [Ilumatobacteraceae bacterium]
MAVGTVVGLFVVQLVWFPLPLGLWIDGLSRGVLGAMLAIGMALVYRANRVVNFAQADLGQVPAGFAAAFILFWGLPYLVGLGLGLLLAAVLGIVVELAIIRRFRGSPRLVVTVATLGISQLLVVLGILVPRWWGRNLASERIAPPLDWKWTIGPVILNANHLIALVVGPICIAAVAWFLGSSRLGSAIRATAERTERAAMLGVPTARLNTVVWGIAAILSFIALFLKAGISGVPIGFAAGLPLLLQALAALVIGRLEHLPTVAFAAIALGLLEFGALNNADSPVLAYPIMAAAIFVVLLVQRTSSARRDNDATSSWRGAEEVRPLPAAVLAHPVVSTAKWTLMALAVMGVVLVPRLLPVGHVIKATALVAFAVIGISLVVLTGWAGQISLGQMAIVGIGAAVSASFTSRWSIDLSLALVVGGIAGGVAAFAVGLPALRLRGLYLAVTTFALALATERWLLNDGYFEWFPRPDDRFGRPPLFGRIDVESTNAYYFYSVVVLVVVFFAVRGIRRSRTGRVIVAMRENERGAQAYAVGIVRAKLTAFVISGVVAGVGGALLVHGNRSFAGGGQFGVGSSFEVFTSAVIGGLGSLGGALLGALYLRGTRWFITSQEWQLLSSGVGVLLVLLILPGGLGSLWVKLRDVGVRLLVRDRRGASGREPTQGLEQTPPRDGSRPDGGAEVGAPEPALPA